MASENFRNLHKGDDDISPLLLSGIILGVGAVIVFLGYVAWKFLLSSPVN